MPHRAPWLVLVLMLALLAAGCGDDSPSAPSQPEPPPGVDREAWRQFQEAPTPPPTTYAGSRLREEARARGLFADLPEAKAENVVALMKALPEAKRQAEAKPGRWGGGAAGRSYEPSDAELVVAEIGRRIQDGIAATPPEGHAALREQAGLDQDLVVPSFREVTVKVFGTGPVQVIEPTSEWIRLGP